ncbi:BON domain-containing protein [Desulfobacula toluolica]|uniref:Transport associated protein n=1 Tax=Desulfobacula toluolica (strain DSM 7467 / Tol2) TaxID=651182 RepID=K0NNE7_DESTT|nr:BON domain-containing protein [Desulfobacula toluolica]CCK80277.1 transport associated protein [Desulfobacula toluolica Tol2]
MNFQNLILFFVLTIALILTGCGAAVVGGAAYGGYKGVTDKRSIGTMVDDSVICTTVKSKMIADEFVKARHIDVDVLKGVVYLIGVVESSSQKRMAADIARGVEGVQRVENQLIIGRTSAGQAFDDTVLTSKIKTELLKTPEIRSTNIDVDTNNNVVTLTGIVKTQREKDKVLYIVYKIAGNRQIVDNLSVSN